MGMTYSQMDGHVNGMSGPLDQEIEREIVKSRHWLPIYAKKLAKISSGEFIDFCLRWGLPIDWLDDPATADNLSNIERVSMTPEGEFMIRNMTSDDFLNHSYASHLLGARIRLGPQRMPDWMKRKLFSLLYTADFISYLERTEKILTVRITNVLFLRLLAKGFFVPVDDRKGRKAVDKALLSVISAYYDHTPYIQAGGHVEQSGLDSLIQAASPFMARKFKEAMRDTIGAEYRRLTSLGNTREINNSGDIDWKAQSLSRRLVDLLGSIPKNSSDKDLITMHSW